MRADLRYAFRLLRRSPGFAAVAVLSLALGIGANTAIYSLFYTIMLRPLPVAHPEQLVELVRNSPSEHHWDGYWSWDSYTDFRDNNHTLSGLTGAGFDNLASIRAENSDPETLILEDVPGNYFQVLGLKPAIGRLTGPDDAPSAGEGTAIVVSWSYWDRRFHRDPAILGKRIFYNDAAKTIVGVAPRDYVGPRVGSRTDVWLPATDVGLIMLGRLKPGVPLVRAQAEIDVLYQAQPRRRAQTRMELLPAAAGFSRVRDQYGKSLVVLIAIVGLLLMLACANMASLLLARSAARRRELAVRIGLGAARGRLVRQMLTESLLLSAAGALAGVLVAYFGIGVLVRIMAGSRAFEHIEVQVHPDPAILLFTATIAVVTGLLFGLAPAWHAFRTAPASAMRASGATADTRFWRLFGKTLVSAQVALSIFLVAAAAVFLGHLAHLRSFDLGFRSDHVLLATLDLARSGYKREQFSTPYRELLTRLESLPGVRSASASGCFPLEGCGSGGLYLIAEGRVERPEDRRRTQIVFASPRYFETLGVPLLAGRDFDFRHPSGPRVAIVNQAMARRYFPGANPIGRHVAIDPDPHDLWRAGNQPFEIVGLVGDIKAVDLRDPAYPTIYFDMFREKQLLNRFELRTAVSPQSLALSVSRTVRDVLKTVSVKRISTLEDQVDANIVPEHLLAILSGFFGCLAAVLAGIGVYGLLAYTVARRTGEIGIRMALGATAAGISRLVLRDVLVMVTAGLAAGALLVRWSRPLALGLLPDLKLQILASVGIAAGAMFAIALAASWLPARRASRVDPMVALRHE